MPGETLHQEAESVVQLALASRGDAPGDRWGHGVEVLRQALPSVIDEVRLLALGLPERHTDRHGALCAIERVHERLHRCPRQAGDQEEEHECREQRRAWYLAMGWEIRQEGMPS